MPKPRALPKVYAVEVYEVLAEPRPDWCPANCRWLGHMVGWQVRRSDAVATMIVYPTKKLAMKQVRRQRQWVRRYWKKKGWL